MDAVSYPQPSVIEFISKNLVPLQIPADNKDLGSKYSAKWTPLLLLLDAGGKEYYRTLGFFNPEELIASLLLGLGKASFDRADRPTAIPYFERILREFPKSGSAPEAIYLKGVAGYIETHEVNHLKELHQTLQREFPASTWAMRASPYGLL